MSESDRPPLLSIIVPSFNQGAFIGECLREPLRLANRGVELIVMDGGSSDGTVDTLKTLLGDRYLWKSESDRGQTHAINKGLAAARGDWLAFQNSDDFYLPGKLDLVLDILAETRVDAIIGGMAFVDEKGVPVRLVRPKPIFLPCLSQLNFINNQAFFIRKSLLARVGLLQEELQFCLDYEWFVRIMRSRPRIRYVSDIIGAQRLHGATKTTSLQDKHDEEFAAISQRYFSPSERMVGRLLMHPYRIFRLLYGLTRSARSLVDHAAGF